MINAIGYVRVSTEEQAKEGVSLEHQEAKIRAYCALYDLKLVEIIVDKGFSAKSIKGRPGMELLLKIAKSGEIGAVVVYKLDRLFRERIEALTTEDELRKCGVAIKSFTEHIDTSTAIGRHIFTFMSSQAAFEREQGCERTRDALQHMKDNKQVYNHPPYGWDVIGRIVDGDKVINKGELVENEAEQAVIETMQAMKADGMNLSQIAEQLNMEGVPAKKGGEWSAQTVKNVLEANQEPEAV